MKKTRKTWIAALAAGAAAILCAVLNVCSGGGAFPSVYADKAYDGAFTTQNVALNKSVTLRDLAWTDAVVSYAGLQGDSVAPAVITDGAASPHNSVLYTGVDNSAARAWAVIDLAQEYTLTEIKTSFWNDHAWAGIVVQAATDAEFTQNKITLYSNDTDDTAGQGIGAALAYTDVPDQTQAISFAPVRGRYVRVTNFDPSTPRWGSVFTEIQVFGVTGGIAPPTADRAFEYQSAPFSLALATEYQNAEIFYTTDGSFPTGASAKYTAPIDTAALGSKILIRAAVKTADGAFSLPADFRYSYAAGNVLLGKAETAATFVDSAGLPVATAPWAPAGLGGSLAKITDGAFDAGNPWGTAVDFTPCWIVFDFGAQYSIDKIVMKLWHNWYFGDVFVQLSATADFSTGNYIVANYDYDNSLGLGAGDPAVTVPDSNDLYLENPDDGHTYNFAPFAARYLRIYGVTVNNDARYSVWEEVQAWAHEDTYPEKSGRAIVSASGLSDFSVPHGTGKGAVLADGRLPVAVGVSDDAGGTETLHGTWAASDFDGTVSGQYNLVFTPSDLPSDLTDVYNLLSVTVTVSPAPDKSALAAAIADAEELTETDYTPSTWSPFATALSNARAALAASPIPQEEVNTKTSALTGAQGALVLRADKTALASAIADAQGLSADAYTAATWADLAQPLADAISMRDNHEATAAAVLLALTDLQDALDDLIARADKTALQNRYDELKGTDEGGYTAATWSGFSFALNEAEAVLGKAAAQTSQAEADAALKGLNDGFAALTAKNDFAALNALLAAEASRDADIYTPATKSVYQTKLGSAQSVAADDESGQAAIDGAVSELNEAIAALRVKADKTALNAALQGRITASGAYTASSFNAYTSAFEAAQVVNEDLEAIQSEVDAALQELNAKIDALTALADKTALNAAIAAAEAVDTEGCTDESVAFLEDAILYAKGIAASNDVPQADADEAAELLNEAVEGLERPVEPSDPADPTEPTDPADPTDTTETPKPTEPEGGCSDCSGAAQLLPVLGLLAACLFLFKRKA